VQNPANPRTCEAVLKQRVARQPPDASQTRDRLALGQRLRTARKQRGWTLAQLAQLSDVSITTISRAERGQLVLSYEKLSALGRALQMDMGAMFAQAGDPAKPLSGPAVTRAGGGVAYRGLALTYEFLGTGAAGKQMSPMLGTVHARAIAGPQDFVRHPGQEFVYVLGGAIEVHFDTGERVRLEKGDSLYFDSSIGHAYLTVSRRPGRVLGVTSGESTLQRVARETQATAPRAGKKTRSP
jgi:transcriptional regulator with XRE-family HTH domain